MLNVLQPPKTYHLANNLVISNRLVQFDPLYIIIQPHTKHESKCYQNRQIWNDWKYRFWLFHILRWLLPTVCLPKVKLNFYFQPLRKWAKPLNFANQFLKNDIIKSIKMHLKLGICDFYTKNIFKELKYRRSTNIFPNKFDFKHIITWSYLYILWILIYLLHLFYHSILTENIIVIFKFSCVTLYLFCFVNSWCWAL